MKVNPNISDLFFNTDNTDAVILENGHFASYDDSKLKDSAAMVLGCLERLGITDLPMPRELVADFYGRV